ncbi:MAG TPA: hypothetical protein GXX51_05695 [Firmicutes bacterium]|nr:hypothetical protein [Bacillota bacterium]
MVKVPSDFSGARNITSGELRAVLESIADDLASIKAVLSDFIAKYNAHLGATGLHYNGTAGVTDQANTATDSLVIKTTK